MRNNERIPTPEQLAEYEAIALKVVDMAIDASTGVAYCVCKRGYLDITETVVAIPFRELASLAITYIQVVEVIRARATQTIQSPTPGNH